MNLMKICALCIDESIAEYNGVPLCEDHLKEETEHDPEMHETDYAYDFDGRL